MKLFGCEVKLCQNKKVLVQKMCGLNRWILCKKKDKSLCENLLEK